MSSNYFKKCSNCKWLKINEKREKFYCENAFGNFISTGDVCEYWEGIHTVKEDVVNHPSHYNDGKIEVMDFIEDKQLNFARGNVIKYVSRAGKKDPNKELEDLKKASWYLNREIERLNKEEEQWKK